MKNILKDFGKAAVDGLNDTFEYYAKRDELHEENGFAYAFAQGMLNSLIVLIVASGITTVAKGVGEKLSK